MSGGTVNPEAIGLSIRGQDSEKFIPIIGKLTLKPCIPESYEAAIYRPSKKLVDLINSPYKLAGTEKIKVRFVEENEIFSVEVRNLFVPFFTRGQNPFTGKQEKFEGLIQDFSFCWPTLRVRGDKIQVYSDDQYRLYINPSFITQRDEVNFLTKIHQEG